MKVRLTESKLKQIVAESVKNVLNELATPEQLAHLAGQAKGSTDTFGGKVKGFFNPKWKARKERQEKLFADTAAGKPNGYQNSVSGGGKNYHDFNKTFTPGRVNGAMINTNNSGNGERFNIERNNATFYDGYSKMMPHEQDGQTYTPNEYMRADFSDYNVNQNDQYDLAYNTQSLNRAYEHGRKASNGTYGKGAKTYGGTSLSGTGRKNAMYQELGKN